MGRLVDGRDRLLGLGTGLAAALVAVACAWLCLDVVARGLPRLSVGFVTEPVLAAGRAGGVGPVILSTLWILAVCLLASVPLALGTAAWLAEPGGEQVAARRWARGSLEVLAGVPSIVFGLFGNAFFCQALGLGFSILAGGLTLACMVLPILARTAEEAFSAVPSEWRLGAAALGLDPPAVFFRVVLPAAAPAVLAGLVLGVGRALAETAALVFTSGYVDRTPSSWLDSGRALSVHVYDLSMNVPGGNDNAYGSALVLVGLLLGINGAVALVRGGLRRRLGAA